MENTYQDASVVSTASVTYYNDIVTNLIMEVNARNCVWVKLSSASELKAIKDALKSLNLTDCIYGESNDKADGYVIGIVLGSVKSRTSKWLDDMMGYVDELDMNFPPSDESYGSRLGDYIGKFFHKELKFAIKRYLKWLKK